MKQFDWADRIPEPVINLINRLDEHGYETWLVGGCVRDMSLGIMPDDYDAATSARPEQVCRLFERCLETGIRHGTVTVLIDGMSIEVTTFRSEGPYTDGRRPDHIKFESGILPDLARRDFTINSMAWHPKQGLTDPFNGMSDLHNQILRCVGSAAERMQEDALRQVRAVRFSLTFDLTPDNELINAVRQGYHRVMQLSPERISHELKRLMIAPYSHNLAGFAGTCLLSTIIKKLFGLYFNDIKLSKNMICFIQPFWHREQIWPACYLACLMTSLEVNPQYLQDKPVGHYSLESWLTVKSRLSRKALSQFVQNLLVYAKVSKEQSRYAEAILVITGLRLMFLNSSRRHYLNKQKISSSDRGFSDDFNSCYSLTKHQIKVLIRSCLKSTRLRADQLMECLVFSIEIMHALQAGTALGRLLEQERALVINMKPEILLVSKQSLSIRGSNVQFNRLTRPSLTGLYMERLLSLRTHKDVEYSDHKMEKLLAGWIDSRLSTD